MDFDLSDLMTTKLSFVKSHTCSGRMERNYSEFLGEYFEQYNNSLCNFFEVGDLSFIDVYKAKFGFLNVANPIIQNILETCLSFEQTLETEKIKSTCYFCVYGDSRFIINVWDIQDKHTICCIYSKKKKDINEIISKVLSSE